MTLQEAAYNLLNILRAGRSTNNEYISVEQIKFNIKYYRALLIRRDIDVLGNRQLSGGGEGGSHNSSTSLRELEQALDAITFSSVATVDGTNVLPADNLDNLYISSKKIPTTVRLKGRSGITYVGNQEQTRAPIPMIHHTEAIWKQYNKFTSGRTFCYFLNEYLYITNSDVDPDDVLIIGIFEDPEEAYNCTTDSDNVDWDDNINDYPLPADMYQRLAQSLLNGELRLLMGGLNDTSHNQLPDEQLTRSSNLP